jgi:hypothetical protein
MSARLLQHQSTPMRSLGVSSSNSLLCRNSGKLHRRRMLSDTLSNFRCAAALVLPLLLWPAGCCRDQGFCLCHACLQPAACAN